MRIIRRVWFAAALVWMLASMAMMAMGAENIERYNINFDRGSAGTGYWVEPQISLGQSQGGMYIEEVEWKTQPDRWKAGQDQKVVVRIGKDDSAMFIRYQNKKYWSVSGAEFVKCTMSDGVLEATFNFAPHMILEQPEEAGWSKTEIGIAKWKSVKYASAYEVILYKDEEVKKKMTVTTNSADFSDLISSVNDMYFSVRAVPKDSKQAKYLTASDWTSTTDADFYYENLGMTEGTWKTSGQSYKYQLPDGSFVVSRWEMIAGYWYYFNGEGLAVQGWQNIGGKWYYLQADGRMSTGWVQLDQVWYYLSGDGSMVTGWYMVEPAKWYYFYDNGAMAANTDIGGYVVNETGLWIQ